MLTMTAPPFILMLLLLCLLTFPTTMAQLPLLWSDEFDSSSMPDANVWSVDTGGGGWGNAEIQTYSEDNVKVENGNLVITTTSEKDEWVGRTFESGRIRSNTKLEFMYGTVEAKIQVPDVGNGLWPAFWMLGTTFPNVAQWPESGEIDIMELGSARALQLDKATTRVGSAVHWKAFNRTQQKYNELDTDFDMSEKFHVYKLEWTPTRITTFVDDIPIVQKNISPEVCFECEELHQPYFMVVNMAVGGGYTRIYHEWGITAELPAEMLVDYIRIYDNGHTQLSGSLVDTPPPTGTPTKSPTTSEPTASPTAVENRGSKEEEEEDEEEKDKDESPTLEPTPSPVESSSSPSPSASPTQSLPKTEAPTVGSTKPSDLPVQRLEATGVQMTFSNIQALDSTSVEAWSDVTCDFLATQVTTAIGLVESVNVDVSLVSQDPPFNVRRRRRRRLQDEAMNRTLFFDAIFEIQSVVEVNDANRYIIGAFNTLEKKESYLTTLQAVDTAFVEANDVVVTPAKSISRVVENPNADDENNTGLGIGLIVGIVMAVLAIVCLVAALVYSKRRLSASKNKRQELKSCAASEQHQESPTAKAYRGDDDSLYQLPAETTPSTCEESLYTSPSKGTLDYQFTCPRKSKLPDSVFTSDSDFADYIASFRHKDPEPVLADDTESEFTAGSQTYDYSAAYKNVQGSIADEQSQATGQVTNDDLTIVSEFEVRAPPGSLGIVLDSSDDGAPVVQTVSKTSPLFGQVHTGDRLLSVDGRDVTMVMASTVSRVIASKKDNPKRIFVFARPMEI